MIIKDLNCETTKELKRKIASVQNAEPTIISFDDEKLAFYITGLFRPKNIYDCFVIFSAGTLCNSYVKKAYASKEYKNCYAFKGFLDVQFDRVLDNPIDNVKILHNDKFSVADVFGLKFSYHGLGDVKGKGNITAKKADKYWHQDGLRLTPFAKELFDISKEFIANGKVSKQNADIFKIIEDKLVKVNKDEAKIIVNNILTDLREEDTKSL